MNLVIDNAVEIKQITKTNDKETRKPLGTDEYSPIQLCSRQIADCVE